MPARGDVLWVMVSRIGRLVMQGVLDKAAWDAGLAAIVETVHADHLVATLRQEMGNPYPRVTPLAWGSASLMKA